MFLSYFWEHTPLACWCRASRPTHQSALCRWRLVGQKNFLSWCPPALEPRARAFPNARRNTGGCGEARFFGLWGRGLVPRISPATPPQTAGSVNLLCRITSRPATAHIRCRLGADRSKSHATAGQEYVAVQGR